MKEVNRSSFWLSFSENWGGNTQVQPRVTPSAVVVVHFTRFGNSSTSPVIYCPGPDAAPDPDDKSSNFPGGEKFIISRISASIKPTANCFCFVFFGSLVKPRLQGGVSSKVRRVQEAVSLAKKHSFIISFGYTYTVKTINLKGYYRFTKLGPVAVL